MDIRCFTNICTLFLLIKTSDFVIKMLSKDTASMRYFALRLTTMWLCSYVYFWYGTTMENPYTSLDWRYVLLAAIVIKVVSVLLNRIQRREVFRVCVYSDYQREEEKKRQQEAEMEDEERRNWKPDRSKVFIPSFPTELPESKHVLILGKSGAGQGIHPWDSLKPCPCGCEEKPLLMYEKDKVYYCGGPTDTVYAECPVCGRSTETKDLTTVIDDWNSMNNGLRRVNGRLLIRYKEFKKEEIFKSAKKDNIEIYVFEENRFKLLDIDSESEELDELWIWNYQSDIGGLQISLIDEMMVQDKNHILFK